MNKYKNPKDSYLLNCKMPNNKMWKDKLGILENALKVAKKIFIPDFTCQNIFVKVFVLCPLQLILSYCKEKN